MSEILLLGRRLLRGRAKGKRTAGLGLAVTVLGVIAISAPSASAAVKPFEVDAYARALNVPNAVARDDLEVQANGGTANIAGDLEDRLNDDFAGVWFDPESGEYVVPLASATVDAAVDKEMAAAQLSDDYRTRVVQYSWEELEAAQEQIDIKLSEFFDASLVYTSLDPRTNAAVVHVAAAANQKDRATLRRIAKDVGGQVELRADNEDLFQGVRDACSNLVPNCGSPLRGGVEIGPWKTANGGTCTAAFRAIGKTNGKKYLLSAGHCAAAKNPSNPILNWQARDEQKLPAYGQAKYLGEVEQLAFPSHDWMKINVTGSEWDIPLLNWPSMVAYWSKGSGVAGQPPIDAEYPIYGEAASVVGQGVCHSGIASGGTCGQVVETDVSYNFGEPGNTTHDLVEVKGACSEGGDSGGPWFASNIAYGIHIGKTSVLEACGSSTYYEEITVATQALGVTVGTATPPPSPPVPGNYQMAFQANTGSLVSIGPGTGTNWGQGMAAGTSPSIARLANGTRIMAFQTNKGELATIGPFGATYWGQGMAPGTSPSIAGLSNGSYVVAFQTPQGTLASIGPAGATYWGQGMLSGTSPSIAGLWNGSYEIAFQANTGSLISIGPGNGTNWGQGMAGGTSPSIAALSNGSYVMAFQTNKGELASIGPAGATYWGQGMKAGTSPSIALLSSGNYVMGFQANTGSLVSIGPGTGTNWGQGMAPGTSPSIAGLSSGSYVIAFTTNQNLLASIGPGGATYWAQGMAGGTSPSMSGG